jgi:hypothetical protein
MSVEIYNPATNSWTVAGAMITPRGDVAATVLPNGKVVVAGGFGGGDEALHTAELYNPATNMWTPTGNLNVGRRGYALALLSDGRVLIVGGVNGGSAALASAEIYNPQTGNWSFTVPPATRRFGHTATTLINGHVLVAGGLDNVPADDITFAAADLYDPVNDTWLATGALATARTDHAAVRLPNGQPLVIGGSNGQSASIVRYASTEGFDPTGTVITYPLTLLTSGPGSVTASPSDSQYVAGTTVTMTATPHPGAVFIGWMIGNTPAGWRGQLAITMAGPRTVTATFVAAPTFPDVAPNTSEWSAITQLAARGIVKGYSDSNFGPADGTLRAQLAAFICRTVGWAEQDWGNPFTDQGEVDAELWRNVGTLAHYGVAQGYGDGTFGPTDSILRAQAISFITRAMVNKGYWQPQPDNPALFDNVPASSGHRQDIATYIHYAGPTPDGSVTGPFAEWDQPGTRAGFARALWRAMDSYFGQ